MQLPVLTAVTTDLLFLLLRWVFLITNGHEEHLDTMLCMSSLLLSKSPHWDSCGSGAGGFVEESYPKRKEFTGVGGRQGEQLLLMEEAEATGVVERLLLMRGLESGHQPSKCTWNLACIFAQEVLTPSPTPHLPLWSMGFSHFIQVYPLRSSSWEPGNPPDLDLSATIKLSGTTFPLFFCCFSICRSGRGS